MPAMVVSVNGKRTCAVKLTTKNTRSFILCWMGPSDFYGNVGGVDGERHVRWDLPEVNVGDTIEVKLVESAKTDPPHTRKTLLQLMTPEERKRYRKQQLAKRRRKKATA